MGEYYIGPLLAGLLTYCMLFFITAYRIQQQSMSEPTSTSLFGGIDTSHNNQFWNHHTSEPLIDTLSIWDNQEVLEKKLKKTWASEDGNEATSAVIKVKGDTIQEWVVFIDEWTQAAEAGAYDDPTKALAAYNKMVPLWQKAADAFWKKGGKAAYLNPAYSEWEVEFIQSEDGQAGIAPTKYLLDHVPAGPRLFWSYDQWKKIEAEVLQRMKEEWKKKHPELNEQSDNNRGSDQPSSNQRDSRSPTTPQQRQQQQQQQQQQQPTNNQLQAERIQQLEIQLQQLRQTANLNQNPIRKQVRFADRPEFHRQEGFASSFQSAQRSTPTQLHHKRRRLDDAPIPQYSSRSISDQRYGQPNIMTLNPQFRQHQHTTTSNPIHTQSNSQILTHHYQPQHSQFRSTDTNTYDNSYATTNFASNPHDNSHATNLAPTAHDISHANNLAHTTHDISHTNNLALTSNDIPQSTNSATTTPNNSHTITTTTNSHDSRPNPSNTDNSRQNTNTNNQSQTNSGLSLPSLNGQRLASAVETAHQQPNNSILQQQV